MQRLRSALLGCLLAGGLVFGPPPVEQRRRWDRPIVNAAGPGERQGMSADDFARWFRPPLPGATLQSLHAQAGFAVEDPVARLPLPLVWQASVEDAVGAPAPAQPRRRIRCLEAVGRRSRAR